MQLVVRAARSAVSASLIAVVAFMAGVLLDPSLAEAVTVPATASGAFGKPVDGPTDLVLGYTFVGVETVELTASGIAYLGLGGTMPTGPDGLTSPRGDMIGPFGTAWTPLEEVLVDAGTPPPIGDPLSSVLNVGALIGAFVPEAVAALPGFTPRDEDVAAVGIPSSALFLIGAGPFDFSAPGPGRLYLGINDPFVSNNSGSFEVTLTTVPEPGTLALLGVGVSGLAAMGARRRRDDG